MRYAIITIPTGEMSPTDEMDAVRVVTIPPVSLMAPPPSTATTLGRMAVTELSQDAFDRLRAELDDLRTRGRIDIARAIEAARALGDLSENGDYHAAKDAQGKMEARIRQLEAILADVVIVEKATTTNGEVSTGTVVSLRYAGDDDVERYLIGSIEERREGVAVVSPNSPLGQALIGKKEGDRVSYDAPSGSLEVEIVEVGA